MSILKLIDKYSKERQSIADMLSKGVEYEADRIVLIGKANTLIKIIKDLQGLLETEIFLQAQVKVTPSVQQALMRRPSSEYPRSIKASPSNTLSARFSQKVL